MQIYKNGKIRNEQVGKRYKNADRLRGIYPPGTRIILIKMNDDPAPVPADTRGTVTSVDSMGTIHVRWDNGRTLSAIPGVDRFRKLTAQEIQEEQQGMAVPRMEAQSL